MFAEGANVWSNKRANRNYERGAITSSTPNSSKITPMLKLIRFVVIITSFFGTFHDASLMSREEIQKLRIFITRRFPRKPQSARSIPSAKSIPSARSIPSPRGVPLERDFPFNMRFSFSNYSEFRSLNWIGLAFSPSLNLSACCVYYLSNDRAAIKS